MYDAIMRHLLDDEEGQTMAEYAIVLSVITIGVIVALAALVPGISNRIGVVVGHLS